MRQLKLYITILTAFLSVIWVTGAKSSDFDDFQMSDKLIKGGRYLEAIGVYKDVASHSSSTSNRARALLFTGFIYSNYLDQPDTALSAYQSLLNRFPYTQAAPDALLNSGIIEFNKGQYQSALILFNRFIKKYPGNMRLNSAKAWAKASEAKAPEQLKAVDISSTGINIPPDISVLIKQDISKARIYAKSPLQVTRGAITLFKGKATLLFSIKKGQPVFNGSPVIPGEKIRIQTTNGAPLILNGSKFRGDFLIKPGKKTYTIVNRLSMDAYLKGVVPCEMSESWAFESLKAQAIASRTYACYIKKKNSANTFYDILATTASQVYGGMDRETDRTSRAVSETSGQVMTWNNRLIVAYFHANSGGYCEDPVNVWGAKVPYLQSVSDRYSTIDQPEKWQYHISYDLLEKKLKKNIKDLSTLTGIAIANKSPSGRAISLYLYNGGKKYRISANNFRLHIGPTDIRSTLFDLQPQKNGVIFTGSGYGHGVGMSQWGAHQMALSGRSYESILKHYYHNITIQGT